MPKKKKVVKQKQKQKQSQYVKVNITNPVKKIYRKGSSQPQRTPYIFQGTSSPPIINVSVPSQERNFEKYFEQLKESLAQKIGEPIGDKFNLKKPSFIEETEEPLQLAETIPLPKTRGQKTQTDKPKPKLIIQEEMETQTDLGEFESKIPRLSKEPTIAELKKKYVNLTGDKESAKTINRGNKQSFIDLINRMEAKNNL
jgi:hypothetical protein